MFYHLKNVEIKDYNVMIDDARRTASEKALKDKTFNIAINLKYDKYQRGLTSMVYNFFDKKPLVVMLLMKLKKMNN